MIRLENVNKYFNYRKKNEIHVIDNTSLDLPNKGLVALLGPSGCGKTTLLNAVSGLDRIKSGKIYVNGKKITKRSSHYIDKIRNLNIGYIFQNYNLVDNMTVYDNVALTLKMLGIKDKNEIKTRVSYVLETLGIYRYRNRPANMLSGGEKQRVGIARAIVKNPNIIIADEPTGNLDSSNTIETMNIIKSISKERLVLLVTHENDLANFYADRIIEIEDGKIKKDYENKHNNNLDYRVENKFYLKDFKNISNFKNDDNEINIYNDLKNDIKLTIVVKGNNIFIKGGKNDKIEVVDSDSNIEFINDHYKQIDKSIYEKYEFNFDNIINKNIKTRYSSIFNPITLITSGFKKIFDYSFIKKLLLLGFFASGAFITYSVSNIFGITHIEDKYFITKNREYYDVSLPSIKVDDYLKYEKLASVDYILPASSRIVFEMKFPFYYQSSDTYATFDGSLTSVDYLSKDDLVYGRLPENDYEIVIDKMTIEKNDTTIAKQLGIKDVKDYLNMKVNLLNLKEFTIVGISSKNDPSIYARKDMLINMLSNSFSEDKLPLLENEAGQITENYVDYKLYDDIKIVKGRLPENDYEIILNKMNIDYYEIGSKIANKINGNKLTVVGFYESNNTKAELTNSNTIKYNLITTSKNLTVMPKDKDEVVSDFNKNNLNIKSSYKVSKESYKANQKKSVDAGLTVCFVILGISFIEIYLMVRASFLSRIKEIGIYRAIGVKKIDIYKMFFGEIFAITTIACIPGILFVSYALSSLQTLKYFTENYMVNGFTIIFSLVLIYLFNIIVGLLPVMTVVKDTPAQILSRKDLE